MLPHETEKNHKAVLEKKDDLTLAVTTKQGIKNYSFDSVFDEKSTQVLSKNKKN